MATKDADEIYRRVGIFMWQSDLPELVCEVEGVVDLGVVNVLARIQLMCRRRGVLLRIGTTASAEDLGALLSHFGLAGHIGIDTEWLQTSGQPEARE